MSAGQWSKFDRRRAFINLKGKKSKERLQVPNADQSISLLSGRLLSSSATHGSASPRRLTRHADRFNSISLATLSSAIFPTNA